METLTEYYTYAYLREDKTPYYVGKGKHNRAYIKRKDGVNPPKDKSKIIILKQNLTENEAFRHEEYMIAVFGRTNLGTGILRNKTNGGEGSSGLVHSEEWRKTHSKRMKGKNNPNYGKTHPEKTKQKISEAQRGEKNHNYGKPRSEKTRKLISKSQIGENNSGYNTKWWNDGCGNYKRSKECPGENWVLGMGNKKTHKELSQNS